MQLGLRDSFATSPALFAITLAVAEPTPVGNRRQYQQKRGLGYVYQADPPDNRRDHDSDASVHGRMSHSCAHAASNISKGTSISRIDANISIRTFARWATILRTLAILPRNGPMMICTSSPALIDL